MRTDCKELIIQSTVLNLFNFSLSNLSSLSDHISLNFRVIPVATFIRDIIHSSVMPSFFGHGYLHFLPYRQRRDSLFQDS